METFEVFIEERDTLIPHLYSIHFTDRTSILPLVFYTKFFSSVLDHHLGVQVITLQVSEDEWCMVYVWKLL